MKNLLVCIFVILITFGFFVSAGFAASVRSQAPASRQIPTAPDFTLKDLNGNDVTLSSFKGKKVLLVFGATWCPYCVKEVPELNAFYGKHKDADVKIINIDIQESIAKVKGFVQKHNMKYTVVIDPDGKVAAQYNVYGIPAVFLVDENGIIKYSGSTPHDGFEALLK